MSFLIAIVLPFVYVIVALLVVVPAWKRAVEKQGSYNSAWVRTLIVGLPILLLVANRAVVYWADREVDRLCAKDGGVHVYETVTLAPENFGADGTVFPQYELLSAQRHDLVLRYGPEYSTVSKDSFLRAGKRMFVPGIRRHVTQYVRRADGMVLAEMVRYSRFGGGLPGPWVERGNSCEAKLYPPYFENQFFINSGREQ